jgi:hypothetical protein
VFLQGKEPAKPTAVKSPKCLLKRTPVANQNQVSISRGTWDEIPFASCHWSELAAVGGRCLPMPTLLPWKTQSQAAVYSSQATYDVPLLYREPFRRVGQGLILHGGHSAMVPIERLPDGSVRWHFETKGAQGPVLRPKGMRSLKRRWYPTSRL